MPSIKNTRLAPRVLFPLVIGMSLSISACDEQTPKDERPSKTPEKPLTKPAAKPPAQPDEAKQPGASDASDPWRGIAIPYGMSKTKLAESDDKVVSKKPEEATAPQIKIAESISPAVEPWQDIDIPFKKFVLDNGLTLVVHEDRKAPLIAVNVWYHVGAKNETKGITGFAHLFEHLMFNGSENYNKDWFKAAESIGASALNGTTSEDRTNYFQNVPTNAIDTILMLESDRMGYLLGAIDQGKLDEQRNVVKNEKRQRENQPYGMQWGTLTENTFPPGHPYSWPVIGYMEDLNAASLDDVHNWFKSYYGPNNATIVLAGDISAEDALKKVTHWFGDIPRGPEVTQPKIDHAVLTENIRKVIHDKVPQARVVRSWNVPDMNHPDVDLLSIAVDVLAGGKNSRLYKRLVLEDKIASSTWAYLDDRELASQFLISATALKEEDLPKVEKAIEEELAKYLKTGPTAEELQRMRAVFYAGSVAALERIDGFGGKSDVLARSTVLSGAPDAWKKGFATMFTATPADARDSAQRWLSKPHYTMEIRRGEREAETTEARDRLMASNYPVPKAPAVLPAAEKPIVSKADRSSVPTPTAAADLKLPKLQRFTLKNGLKVALAERHEAPLVKLSMMFRSGYSVSVDGKEGLASLAMGMLDEGTTSRTNLEIAKELEAIGAGMGAGASVDFSSVGLSALTAKLDPALAVYADVLRNPAFPEKELARIRAQTLAGLKQEKARPTSLGLRILPPILFGKHPYGQPLTGSGYEQVISAATTDQLKAYYQQWIRPDNATLLVVGDITQEQLAPKLEKHLGDWQGKGELSTVKLPNVTEEAKPAVYMMDRKGSSQTIVLAGHLAPPKKDVDDIRFIVTNAVLGRMFTSRLNMKLREEKGWSYGAGSFVMPTLGQRMFGAYAQVQTDKTAPAMQETINIMRAMTTPDTSITEQELALAKKYLTLKLPGKNETISQVAGTMSKLIKYDLPDEYYTQFISKVNKQQRTNVIKAAQRLIQPEKLVWVIVGDLEKIEPAVRELKLGPVTIINDKGEKLR